MGVWNRISFFIFFAFMSLGECFALGNLIKSGDQYYLSDRLIVKLRAGGSLSDILLLKEKSGDALKKVLASNSCPRFKCSGDPDYSLAQEGLSRVYSIPLDKGSDPKLISEKITKSGLVEYAEPWFVYPVKEIPDDPGYKQQWALSKIGADRAWNITKGDKKVIIAIVDTGVDWAHPDLAQNIWVNPVPDPSKNDIRGWDFGGSAWYNGQGSPDNDPMEDRPEHGTHVAGCADAVTGNGIGIAGVACGCSLMPVKASCNGYRDENNEALIVYGDEGIQYAADHGASVINCSWGGDGYSQASQDVINYAISKGALVVAAAGNDGKNGIIYPANYSGVLSVGATDEHDSIAWFSNYGRSLTVTAPGVNIYSTWQPDTYNTLNGTSMASPIVAGVAALVKSRFPNYSPAQIREQIRVTSDNIDSLNPGYEMNFGYGRVNAYRAVTETGAVSVRESGVAISDQNSDGYYDSGESLSMVFNFNNILNPTSVLNVSLVSNSPWIEVLQGSFSAGPAPSGASFDNGSRPFVIKIKDGAPQDQKAELRLEYSGGAYSDYQWVSLDINKSFRTQSTSNLALSIGSNGNLGYIDFPDNLLGEGCRFMGGSSILCEGSFMYGTGGSTIFDAARNSDNSKDADFSTIKTFRLVKDSVLSKGYTVFNDRSLGIETSLYTYAYSDKTDADFIILKYVLKNKSSANIAGLCAGLFFDWDIASSSSNYASWDSDNKFGYVYSKGSTYVGTALLSPYGSKGFYAIDNSGSSGIGIYGGFSKANKWLCLSSGIFNEIASYRSSGDVSYLISGGPYDILPGAEQEVTFAIAAGNNQTELVQAINRSRSVYKSLPSGVEKEAETPLSFSLGRNYPNPFNPSTRINFSIDEEGEGSLSVYDILGRQVAVLKSGLMRPGSYEAVWNSAGMASGIYIYRLIQNGRSLSRRMCLIK